MRHLFPRYRSVQFVIIVLSLVCLASSATLLTHSHAASASPKAVGFPRMAVPTQMHSLQFCIAR